MDVLTSLRVKGNGAQVLTLTSRILRTTICTTSLVVQDYGRKYRKAYDKERSERGHSHREATRSARSQKRQGI